MIQHIIHAPYSTVREEPRICVPTTGALWPRAGVCVDAYRCPAHSERWTTSNDPTACARARVACGRIIASTATRDANLVHLAAVETSTAVEQVGIGVDAALRSETADSAEAELVGPCAGVARRASTRYTRLAHHASCAKHPAVRAVALQVRAAHVHWKRREAWLTYTHPCDACLTRRAPAVRHSAVRRI